MGSAKSRHHTAIALASVLTRCASKLRHSIRRACASSSAHHCRHHRFSLLIRLIQLGVVVDGEVGQTLAN